MNLVLLNNTTINIIQATLCKNNLTIVYVKLLNFKVKLKDWNFLKTKILRIHKKNRTLHLQSNP